MARKILTFDDKTITNGAGFGGNRAATGPGDHHVRYESILTTFTNDGSLGRLCFADPMVVPARILGWSSRIDLALVAHANGRLLDLSRGATAKQ